MACSLGLIICSVKNFSPRMEPSKKRATPLKNLKKSDKLNMSNCAPYIRKRPPATAQ